MEWFEYIIIVVAIFLVALPFVLSSKNKKNGKSCCGGCRSCSSKETCHKNTQFHLSQLKEKK